MKLRVAFALAAALVVPSCGDPVLDASAGASRPASVVFVCRNGVAMSVWSTTYFNRLAAEAGLADRAVSRAAMASYREVPLRMRLALRLDGFRLDGLRPQVVGAGDARNAEVIVLIDDAELPPELAHEAARTERWQGFPPMREQYFASRAALEERVERLAARLAARATP